MAGREAAGCESAARGGGARRGRGSRRKGRMRLWGAGGRLRETARGAPARAASRHSPSRDRRRAAGTACLRPRRPGARAAPSWPDPCRQPTLAHSHALARPSAGPSSRLWVRVSAPSAREGLIRAHLTRGAAGSLLGGPGAAAASTGVESREWRAKRWIPARAVLPFLQAAGRQAVPIARHCTCRSGRGRGPYSPRARGQAWGKGSIA